MSALSLANVNCAHVWSLAPKNNIVIAAKQVVRTNAELRLAVKSAGKNEAFITSMSRWGVGAKSSWTNLVVR